MADLRPADDGSIPGGERLYIRIYPTPDSLKQLDDGQYRPTSGGVKARDRDEPLSVDLGSVCTAEQTRDRGTNGNFHVAVVTAAAIRGLGLGLRIGRDPIADGPIPNPAHALIYGSRTNADDNQAGGLTKGEYSAVAHAARMAIVTPQPVPKEPGDE